MSLAFRVQPLGLAIRLSTGEMYSKPVWRYLLVLHMLFSTGLLRLRLACVEHELSALG